MAKAKVTVIETVRHPGDERVIAVLELPRVPARGDYLTIKNRRVKVERVDFRDNGDVVVKVE